MTAAESPVVPILDTYKAAVYARDVEAFVALYAPDVNIFDMWGAWSYHGLAAWRQVVEGWFGSLGTERVIVGFDDIQTTTAQDLAAAHLFVSYQAISADGVTLRAMQNRMSLTLQRNPGGWEIVHQHTSAPIDFATTKAIFQRD